ncbi:MAG: hypothetical protein LBI15_02375 [Dysgonamonadaceae bacterium]|jgi:hypothetical protein|nr:hypothetical protein [Dysgonamonadaceae bacterium]
MTKNDFIEYQTFSDLQEASELTNLLNANQIPFEIDDSAMRFDISARDLNPIAEGIIIKINADDVERVDKINPRKKEIDCLDDHFLYSFSDNDIMDILVNPEEWTDEEIELAKEIAKQRNLQLTVEAVKYSRKKSYTEKEKKVREQITEENEIIGRASWFGAIGSLSLLNSLFIIFQVGFFFPVGLAIDIFILGSVSGVEMATDTDLTSLRFVLISLMPILFFWIGRKSRKGNLKVYLVGMILYAIDTSLCLLTQYWVGLVFHLFVLFALCDGYIRLIKNKRAKELEQELYTIKEKEKIAQNA